MSIFKIETGQGENIVLVHGWGCDLRQMQPLVEQLSNRYCVTNIDLPGRGQSSWEPQIHTIHDIADYLLPSLPQEKAVYIGWSLRKKYVCVEYIVTAIEIASF
ncbi:MAG: alpha/beta fold hydrolase [Legionellales bacterium]|nr:alpha/beta fold hydrolase [Legionellales bacterium]